MNIRRATINDIDGIMPVLEEYYHFIWGDRKFNFEYAKKSLIKMICNPNIYMSIFCESDIILGIVSAIFMVSLLDEYIEGQELFWYSSSKIKKIKRGKILKLLFDDIISVCKNVNCKTFFMNATNNTDVKPFLERNGFKFTEFNMIKEF